MGARLDQHFLADPAAADAIVGAAGIRPGTTVVEIGPGRGVLTQRMLFLGAKVTAVEIDSRLAHSLPDRLKDASLSMVCADFLRLDLASLPSPCTIVSNLPYAVGTPIMLKLLEWPAWETAVLMFQKEVALRLVSEPGTRDYGTLTLAVQLRADAEYMIDVPAEAFRPMPKVDSGVVRLTRLKAPRLPEGLTEGEFNRVIHSAFSQRRKMAAKLLASALNLPRPTVDAAFSTSGIEPTARAETISLAQFAALTRALKAAA
ncbi:MAG: ribosomal RNA small subunit methyltransferase A [Elusimicrobia bacterium]|nr:ribosomal RNA small subunit methyltransferase A [Elusimicrobiota bacterium]